MPAKDVTPRLSLIVAIDTLGNVYLSMTQVNTDNEVFCVFLSKLVAKLQKEDAKWHTKTILLLDNASYHKHDGVINQLKLQGADTLFLGPYSWLTAPAELAFAFLKR